MRLGLVFESIGFDAAGVAHVENFADSGKGQKIREVILLAGDMASQEHWST
jgi:hypothetical protein